VARFLLTEPGAPRDSIRPVKVTGHIASLKWTRPEYVRMLRETYGPDVDYAEKPAEDFASVLIEFRDAQDRTLIAETTTSWSYVGAGLRLSAELLGPEYMMQVNSLDTSANVFFSRHIKTPEGEDMLEKQNAEQGLMPIIGNEAFEYGYENENRSFVQSFLRGEQPEEGFDAGLEVTELLMTAYMSAEQERTIGFRPDGLDEFIPAVASGTWKP
jgi:predicted dehydrogenase